MPVITLTTEWRPDDIYTGIIKGRLYRLCPEAHIVENAGNIQPFNISQAAFIVRNTYANYPEGSIHIICVHSESVDGNNFLAVRAKGHYFVGTDNGIFNLILNSEPDEIVRLDSEGEKDELSIFAKAAADIYNGRKFSSIGKSVTELSEKLPLRATIDQGVILGSVIFIDSYGNAVSNITRDVFLRVFENKDYRILIQSNKNYTEKLSEKYCDVPVGELLARFNSLDLLEVAINGADISELLSLQVGSVIRVDSTGRDTQPGKLF